MPEPKALVQRLIDAINANELDVMDELFVAPYSEAAKHAFSGFRTAFPDWHEERSLLAPRDRSQGPTARRGFAQMGKRVLPSVGTRLGLRMGSPTLNYRERIAQPATGR